MARRTCPKGHEWEAAEGELACPICHGNSVTLESNAPDVTLSRVDDPALTATAVPAPAGPRTQPLGPGTAVGKPQVPGYEIRDELGRGGMGVVYKARQIALDRLVALKMILAGAHAGEEELNRFRSEALAVARMHHPNIVQIHEIGQHDAHPYFSLEYINDGSLAQRLRGNPVAPRAAAELIETLARAIDYAHQQGIVHRDLKPANILLSRNSREDTPRVEEMGPSTLDFSQCTLKIADFGLAKFLEEHSDTSKTSVVGTPSYISPEQAACQKHVGPAVDVYALGAILYEMLTGRPPFRGATPMDTLIMVMGDEPIAPRRFQPKLPVDLETICLKCLQKQPGQRYPTAAALADDLRRFLNHEPIQARPVGTLGRAVRWGRRHPAVAGLSAALLFALVIGLVVVAALWVRAENHLAEAQQQRAQAEENLQEAHRQRRRAEENFRQARQVVDDFYTKVSEGRLRHVPGLQPLRRELLEAALAYYQNFVKEHGDDPSVQAELGRAYYRVGAINATLGSRAKAADAYRQAQGLYARLAADSGNGDLRATLADVDNDLFAVLQETGAVAEGFRYLQEAQTLRQELAREQPANATYQSGLALSHENVGHYQAWTGQVAEAFRSFEQAKSLRETLVRDHPMRRVYQAQLAQSLYDLGYLHLETGQPAAARPLLQEALTIRARLVDSSPQRAVSQEDLAESYMALGDLQRAEGRTGDALRSYEKARELRAPLVEANPDVRPYQRSLAQTDYRTALALRRSGKSSEALAALNRARAVQEKLAEKEPDAFHVQLDLAWTLNKIGQLQREAGQMEEALKTLTQARDLQAKVLRINPDYCDLRSEYGVCLEEMGRTLEALSRRDEAIKAYQQAVEQQRPAFDKAPQVVAYRRHLNSHYLHLARSLREAGRPADAAAASLERQKLWPTNATELYGVAKELAQTAATVGGKEDLTPAEEAQRRRYQDQALEALRAAVQNGFRNVGQLKSDPEWALLRSRDEFQEVVGKVEK